MLLYTILHRQTIVSDTKWWPRGSLQHPLVITFQPISIIRANTPWDIMANQQQDQHHQEHDHNIGNCETTNEIDYLKSIENATIIIKERLIAKSKDSSSLEGGKAAGLWNVFSGLADKVYHRIRTFHDSFHVVI